MLALRTTTRSVKGKMANSPYKSPLRPNESIEAYIYYIFNYDARCVAWLMSCSVRFSPRKEIRYVLYSRLAGPQGWSGRVWKISLTP